MTEHDRFLDLFGAALRQVVIILAAALAVIEAVRH
jgi:hypothetical protein